MITLHLILNSLELYLNITILSLKEERKRWSILNKKITSDDSLKNASNWEVFSLQFSQSKKNIHQAKERTNTIEILVDI